MGGGVPSGRLEGLPWAQNAEKTVTLIILALACEVVVHTRSCKLRAPLFSLLLHQVLSSWSGGITQRGACRCPHPQLQSPESDILLEDGIGKGGSRRPLKKIVFNISPKELKVKPKDALKNCGSYCKKQGDSKYMLNCKPVSLWEKTQNKSLGRSPLGFRTNIKH